MEATELYRNYVGHKAMLTVLSRPEATRTRSTPADEESGVRNKQAVLRKGSVGICIPVHIADARMSYGRPHVLIRPAHGGGSAWVRADHRLQVLAEDEDWPEKMEDTEDEAPPVDVAV